MLRQEGERVLSVVQFWTPGEIPLDSFTIMGANVKTSDNPIGRFGTGLKYAVATILRNGGVIRMYIRETEWEFYLSNKKFRGVEFDQVRMRKKNGLGKWMSSRALPFTTQLGRDWGLWQAYRELESNTRDEGGRTTQTEHLLSDNRGEGTTIEVDCAMFSEAIESEKVFLDADKLERVFCSPTVDIYDAPSKHLYYRGIRVYTLRYPAMFTYDFGQGQVTLTEDRTMGNTWSCMWNLARTIQNDVEDNRILDRILAKSKTASFENYELNFSESGGEFFRDRVRQLGSLGLLGLAGSRNWQETRERDEREASTRIDLPDWCWEHILELLDEREDDKSENIATKIRSNF